MTNTANKHGLRATAEAKRKKHSQRTPLPPKAGVIDDARDAIVAAKAINEAIEKLGKPKAKIRVEPLTKSGRLIPAQRSEVVALANESKTKKGKKAKKGDALAETFKKHIKDTQEAERLEKTSRKGSDSNAKARKASKSPEGLGAKATDFVQHAKDLGWEVSGEHDNGHDAVTVSRSAEAIQIEWQAEVFVNNCLYTRPDGSTLKLRNASHARQVMSAPSPTEEQLAALHRNRQRVGGSGKRTPKRALPWDPESLTDAELSASLQGAKIVWINRLSGQEESDGIASSARVRVSEEPSGRTIHFNSPTGARSVRVSSLIHVAGSKSLQKARKK